ncbi:hypothetical protein [Jiangella asiatica]|uniref:DUF4185 domain-containing protein n=1 Tax=Jiangella asiatica TaxID=2530372 RepID=A0A4R5DJW5_9ACTN|nr:hypothetical protein [Jiangella asiatica]TDE14299.1 hypothetical protein E1269_03850 [Jiangella asiatica]
MNRNLSRRATLVGAAGTLAGAFLARPAASARPRQVAHTGEAWPEADALFKSDPRWRGGDLALPTVLAPGRVLWHFGDSFIDLEPPYERAGSTFIRNSIAIQQGLNPASADIEFHWSMNGAEPRAFFDTALSPVRREPDSVYWCNSSLVVDNGSTSVLATLFAEWTHDALPTRLGTTWAFVPNYQEHPSEWEITYVLGPDVAGELGARFEPRYWSLTRRGSYVEGYGTFHGIISSNPVYRVRWPAAELLNGNVSGGEWKDGDVWRPAADFNGAQPSEAAFTSRALQFSVHQESPGYTMITQSADYGPMAWDHAPTPDGHWGQQFTVVYDHPERQRPGVRVYHNWAVPALTSDDADLIAIYSSNGPNVFEDESTYYPRFVKIHYA